MSQLIPVVPGTLAGETLPTVNARDLHQFLEVGRDFATWIKARIEQYGFEDGTDFAAIPETGERKNQWFSGWKARIDYFLSLDMAKELAMVENNPKGREARRYFIRCERELQAAQAAPALPAPAAPLPAKLHAVPIEEYVALLKDKIALLELQRTARPKRRPFSAEERAEISRRAAAGETPAGIGKAIGRSSDSVATYLRAQRRREVA